MGIVRRQGIKSNIVQLVAIAVGVVSNLLIYTADLEAVRACQGVLTAAILLSPILLLGTPAVFPRYYPHFKPLPNRDRPLFTYGMLLVLLGLFLVGVLGGPLLFYLEPLAQSYAVDLSLYVSYSLQLYLLVIFYTLLRVLDHYTRNYQRVAFQTLFITLGPKVTLPLAFLAYLSGYFSIGDVLWVMIGLAVFSTLVMAVYLYRLGGLRFSLSREGFTKSRWREMLKVGLYGVFGSLGSAFAFRIDLVSVVALVAEKPAGVYFISLFIANIIGLPKQSIVGITTPMIAKAWKEQDLETIGDLYQQTSRTLFAAGGLLCALVLVSLHDLYPLMKNGADMQLGYWSVAFLGAAHLVNMLTSTNDAIIGMSKYFRVNTYLIFLLGIMNLGLNYYFIVGLQLGITGAALATLCAMLVFNTLKLLFIWWKFKLLPFQWASLWTGLVITITAILVYPLPVIIHPLLSIGIRSAILGGVFLGLVWFSPWLPQFKDLLKIGIQRLKTLIR